jgi:acyl-[acyl carrier protein]--UDP-N-acetylglucosamine O-acyltransferase
MGQAMIDLQRHAEACGIAIARDARVETLGLLLDRREAVLAPLYSRGALAELEENRGVAMVLTTEELRGAVPLDRGVAICANPLESFFRLHMRLLATGHYGAPAANELADGVRIHPTAWIAEHDVKIGARAVVGPKAVVEARSVIGEDCRIGAGAVIGAEGMEIRVIGGRPINVPHAGGVRLGSRVTIHANSVVDRALFGDDTEIGDDTAIDNLVHVSHGVRVGKRCHLVAGAFVGGATLVGDDVWIGPNATVSSALKIGDRARISIGAVVTTDLPPDAHVSGNFAVNHLRLLAHLRAIR